MRREKMNVFKAIKMHNMAMELKVMCNTFYINASISDYGAEKMQKSMGNIMSSTGSLLLLFNFYQNKRRNYNESKNMVMSLQCVRIVNRQPKHKQQSLNDKRLYNSKQILCVRE